MYAAPPALPGIPNANSKPVSSFSSAKLQTLLIVIPASQTIVSPFTSSIFGSGRHIFITTVLSPASQISMLLPLPRMNGLIFSFLHSLITETSCSSFSGVSITDAFPPMRKVVYLLIGTSRSALQPMPVAYSKILSKLIVSPLVGL